MDKEREATLEGERSAFPDRIRALGRCGVHATVKEHKGFLDPAITSKAQSTCRCGLLGEESTVLDSALSGSQPLPFSFTTGRRGPQGKSSIMNSKPLSICTVDYLVPTMPPHCALNTRFTRQSLLLSQSSALKLCTVAT